MPAGEAPTYFGQPVAILIFRDFETWRRARRELQFDDSIVRYGAAAEASPPPKPYPPPTYLTRYAEAGVEEFSQTLRGPSNPYAEPATPADAEARARRVKIRALFDDPDIPSFSGSYSTQVLDPMFMEPESGLAWLERGAQDATLHLVLGTQSTNGDIATTLGLFADRHCPIRLSKVVLNACYPGGGFGGRDTSIFPMLLALAAAYADGPVRIANDRFEQFASGLKQLGSRIEQRLAVDSAGRFQAVESRMSLQAGGVNNYSQWVAELAAFSGGGSYRFDKAMIDAAALPSAGVVAGSMRGFGGPQAFYAIECLVDEVAGELGLDAIELRQRNVLLTGDRTVTGAPLTHDMRLAEICERARAHPLWADRAASEAGPGFGGDALRRRICAGQPGLWDRQRRRHGRGRHRRGGPAHGAHELRRHGQWLGDLAGPQHGAPSRRQCAGGRDGGRGAFRRPRPAVGYDAAGKSLGGSALDRGFHAVIERLPDRLPSGPCRRAGRAPAVRGGAAARGLQALGHRPGRARVQRPLAGRKLDGAEAAAAPTGEDRAAAPCRQRLRRHDGACLFPGRLGERRLSARRDHTALPARRPLDPPRAGDGLGHP